jgi:hypothetical protein
VPKQQSDEKPKVAEEAIKSTTTDKPRAPDQTTNTNTTKQTFKKLNPYTPIYGAPINNLAHKKKGHLWRN